MYSSGHTATVVGEVPPTVLARALKELDLNFKDQWQPRTLSMMKDCFVLKAKSHTSRDVLQEAKAQQLSLALDEIVSYIPKSKTEIVSYIDVSLLPPQKYVDLHVDNAIIHTLSRRIHIPLITPVGSRHAFFDSMGVTHIIKLEAGKIYEFNNQIPHAAYNDSNEDRLHIIVDIVEENVFSVIGTRAGEPAVSSVINKLFNPKLVNFIKDELKNPDISKYPTAA